MGDSVGAAEGGWDPVGGALAPSGVPELCSEGVAVKCTPPPAGEGSVFVPSRGEARLLAVSSSLGSVEMFLGSRGAGAEAVAGKTELLGVPLVREAGGLCGELVQMAVEGRVVAGRETGKGDDAGRLCTLNPAVKMQRAKRVLQTMVPWCAVPSSGTDRGFGARTAPPLPGWRP